ncbi:hypothetical protein CIRG_00217 [Coccidioides immitis RMSCC 2394]|uniref:C2H2-type domain-containing protein n=1 Tax=Coccidioides immitis RMSCC 2394 TaxID=404692 RepID=A0A0J6XXF1_COCIT|nr:hypothetical protein CIRG_00217 [Coccidioides immitis RMSCC 2394]
MSTSPYPTPPQTDIHSQTLSAHTSAMGGLDLLGCLPSQQLPICAPGHSLLPSAISWSTDPSAAHCYSNPSPNLGEYQGLGIYESFNTIATTNSPFIAPNTHATIPNAFLSPPSLPRKPTHVMYQRTPILEDMGLHYQSIPATRQSTTPSKKVKISHDGEASQINVQRTSIQEDPLPYQCETYSDPAECNEDPTTTLLELDNNIKRPVPDNRITGEPRRLQNEATNTAQASCPTAVSTSRKRKQARKARTAKKGKFECPKCGMQFTRNSNCKSHMKIHDPDRKYPHKCTFGQCTKQFSRKTDLTRHVDSVHEKLRRFGCSECGHRFARQDTLRRHCEDGCRKQQRQAQRAAAAAAAVTSVSSALSYHVTPVSYQQPASPSPCRELNSEHHQHPHSHQPQISNALMRSALFDNAHNAFSQYT